jgi:hypothetical protein
MQYLAISPDEDFTIFAPSEDATKTLTELLVSEGCKTLIGDEISQVCPL